jgi:hypothetical protein
MLIVMFMYVKAPLALKRLMQGMKVNWEGNPAQKIIIPPTSATTTSTSATKTKLSTFDKKDNKNNISERYRTPEIFQESATTTTFTDGVVHKWIAQLVLTPGADNSDMFSTDVSIQAVTSSPTITTTVTDSTVLPHFLSDTSTASTSTSTSFGALTSSTEVSQKRKRTESSHGLSPIELAYRKKMAVNREHEKVYFLGKFLSEQDARSVLAIVSNESQSCSKRYFICFIKIYKICFLLHIVLN